MGEHEVRMAPEISAFQIISSEPDRRPGKRLPVPWNAGGGHGVRPAPVATGGEHGGWVRIDNQLRVGGTLAWRNNNPGNLLPGRLPYRGAVGLDRRGYAIFRDYEDGWQALRGLLHTRLYSSSTIASALRRYAPRHAGNDPERYASRVRRLTGLDVSRRIGGLNDHELEGFMRAIRVLEGFRGGRAFHRDDPGLAARFTGLFHRKTAPHRPVRHRPARTESGD
ncbi:hypothetical protein [Sinosporangium siamense]|uniref:Uncharacterized protein n=1 Tax=Sinosporangium siamense TaxID=1367973 RepID=A0A919RGR3_9ACTN|nr:hypothetical protein [Sinosporangium siamense]GII91524.1 hypothetical protein Ssi02_17550 [Sinosporangium siamense]